MVGRNPHSHPRAVGGGRSPRYERRKHRLGGARRYAPEWSDAAAAAVLAALHNKSVWPRKIAAFCGKWLLNSTAHAGFIRELRLSPADAVLTATVVASHASKAQAATNEQELMAAVKTFLKPLRERRAARTDAAELQVPAAAEGPATFHVWFSKNPGKDRHRLITKSRRILDGVGSWPLGWLKQRAVVCYERAAGRIDRERGGHSDSAFMRRVVRQQELRTLTANAPDHYVVLTPKKAPRFMTVEETMRAFGIPEAGRTWRCLRAASCPLSAAAAVSCLGRGVHTGVARQLVQMLVADGALEKGARYGSAFSGIDTFATALDAELGEDWTYEFASESNRGVRRGLLHIWSARGLKEPACFEDARGEDAASAPPVDLYVTSPECTAHSRRNHAPSAGDQRLSLECFWSSLEYVRRQTPRTVVVENVNEPSSSGPMTGLLGRLAGYKMATGVLDPRTTAKMPIARERRYWVLTRTL